MTSSESDTGLKKENNLFFEEDEVSCPNDSSRQLGLVTETSEYISSDEEDYEDDEERVKKGSVRVAWYPGGEEKVVEEHILKLEDRSLMPGDVVRRLISGTNSQRGFIKDMRVLCDLRVIGTETVLRGIDAKELLQTEEWEGESELITMDSWVGRLEVITVDIIVRLPDNSRMELQQVDMVDDEFVDVSDAGRNDDSYFRTKNFYEGQILEESYRTLMSRDHEWLTESKVYSKNHNKNCTKKVRLVVEEVITRELEVHWMCRGYSETEAPSSKVQMPPRVIDHHTMSKVRRLDFFEHCRIQIGDRAYFPLPKSDERRQRLLAENAISTDSAPMNEDCTDRDDLCCSNSECTGNQASRTPDQNQNSESPEKNAESSEKQNADTPEQNESEVMENGEVDETEADAEYESGSEDDGETPKTRKRTNSGSKHRGRRGTPRKQTKSHSHRPRKKKGPEKIAVEVVRTLSMVDVMWQDGTVEKAIPSYGLFPIHHLDELEFFPGDFVTRASAEGPTSDYGVVEQVDHQARTCIVKWITPYQIGVSDTPVESEPVEMSVYDIKDHRDYKFRPDQVVIRVCGYENTPGCDEAAGQIVDIEPSGRLIVSWADGTQSKAYPQEVFLISDESSDYSDYGSDQDDSMCSWETEEEQTETETDQEEEDEDMDDREEEAKEKKKKKGKEEEEAKAKTETDDNVSLGPGEKLELDYHLERLESALERPMQPDVIDRIVDCYRNVLTVHKQCLDLDRLLGASHFDDKELLSIISQVRRELRLEKQNKLQTHLLQQAQSYVAARKCHENGRSSPPAMDRDACEGSDTLVPKSKSEPSLTSKQQQQFKILKQSPDGLETVEDIESELVASLEKARTICAAALKALRRQISKVREQLEAMWQKKLDQIKQQKDDEEEEAPQQQVPELMSPDQSRFMPIFEERFILSDAVPSQHNFYSREHTPLDSKAFFTAVKKEMKLLRNNLPAGIKVVGFEERMDLYSVLVVGPSCTPYEDGLFFFDVQLPNSYPAVPPSFHYISYCSDRLNPNLYDDGKVCVSLLGTWGGKGTELWSSSSNMLQVLVSIQGLILNSEPYYNEAGYEKQRGTQMGMENSKVYNEMAILKLVQSMRKIVDHPPEVFRADVVEHMKANSNRMLNRLESWIVQTERHNASESSQPSAAAAVPDGPNGPDASAADVPPDFPLIPASRGFCLTLKTHLTELRTVLRDNGMIR